jgi:hypothetical protein
MMVTSVERSFLSVDGASISNFALVLWKARNGPGHLNRFKLKPQRSSALTNESECMEVSALF